MTEEKEHTIVLPQKMYKVKANSKIEALTEALKRYAKMVRKNQGFDETDTLKNWQR